VSISAKDRMRAYRERVENGVDIFRLELPTVALADVLITAGHLAESEMDDRDAVQAALQRAIEEWVGIEPVTQQRG
jgi:hypothetical protein